MTTGAVCVHANTGRSSDLHPYGKERLTNDHGTTLQEGNTAFRIDAPAGQQIVGVVRREVKSAKITDCLFMSANAKGKRMVVRNFQKEVSKFLLIKKEKKEKKVLLLRDGEYRVEVGDLDENGSFFELEKPIKIYGQGRGETTLVGFGLQIKGNKDGVVEIGDLKIKDCGVFGLNADNGMNLIVKRCTMEKCHEHGLRVWAADVSCDDLQVTGCHGSGVCVFEGTLKLNGEGTRIEGNVTEGDSNSYGVQAYKPSASKIQLVVPLTKETISINNGGGGNWGGSEEHGDIGTIEQVSE